MIWLEIAVGAALFVAVIFMFKRTTGATRTVTHILHDVEHPRRDEP